jgi:trimeric autotransporter adhesin
LGINQAKADAFLNLTIAIRDGKPAQAADILIALSGNNQQVIQSDWIKDLKDGNLANDRQAIQLGLSNLGFQDVTQWVNTIWAVKDGKYLDALAAVLTLGKFAEGQDWVKIIDNLQKENYVEALSTAFKLAKFQDGQSLADAVLAVKKGDYVTAFYESLNLIEGGRDLADAFKYLIEFDLQEFITSMIGAAPLLLKVLI